MDPTTPAEWRHAGLLAHAYLMLYSARAYGLVVADR